jgi:Nitroreductase family
MNREIIQEIIEAGALAPSGSNSQPWSFEVAADGTISLIAYPEKDHAVMNIEYRGTWLAHGAVLENMRVAAAAQGIALTVSLFPDAAQPNKVASITLGAEGSAASDPALAQLARLKPAIAARTTNRKPYPATALSTEDLKAIESAGDHIGAEGSIKTFWITDQEKIKKMGAASATTEILMLENKDLHKLFFEEIVWSRDEEKQRGGGLYIETMEVPPPAKVMLKNVFRRWPLMQIANVLHIPRAIAKGNGMIYGSAPLSGVIAIRGVKSAEKNKFVEAGSVMERIWLTATERGLSMSLITGVLFLRERIKNTGIEGLSPYHAERIEKSYREIQEAADAGDEDMMVCAFRIGKGGEPTARSEKKAPHIVWK